MNLIEPGNIFELPTYDDGTHHLVFESHLDVKLYDEDGNISHVSNVTTIGEGDEMNFFITLVGGCWIII